MVVKGKYILSLNDFCPSQLLHKLGILNTDFELIHDDIYNEKTDDIMQEKSDRYVYILDSKKSKIKSWMTMIDFSRNLLMPNTINIPCWWCREIFITRPIGLPVRYWSKEKSYSREWKDIKEKCESMNIKVDDDFEFFETEGVFCSFPCCKRYIFEHKHNPRYKDATSNLTLLHKLLFNEIVVIPKAPHWKILKRWGGHLTINQFRSSFNKLFYDNTINTMKPIMFLQSEMYQERTKK